MIINVQQNGLDILCNIVMSCIVSLFSETEIVSYRLAAVSYIDVQTRTDAETGCSFEQWSFTNFTN